MNPNLLRFSALYKAGLRRSVLVTSLIALLLGVVTTERVSANDLNIQPATCVAPFLNQAFPMRWTEHFLMNPSDGVETWVVCPVNFDNDVVDLDGTFIVTGAVMSGASASAPVCYFTAYDRRNQKQLPYITGTDRTYGAVIPVTKTGTSWSATLNVDRAGIVASIGGNANNWGAAVFCRLPVGHSVSQIRYVQPGA